MASRALADATAPRQEVLSAMVHMLDHGSPSRPRVAAAIADAAPELRDPTAQALRGYRADPRSDPGRLDGWEDYQDADLWTSLHFAPDLARQGPTGAQAVLKRMSALAATCDTATAAPIAEALLRIGGRTLDAARSAIDAILARAVPVGLAAEPLASLDSTLVPYAVQVALASLELDPEPWFKGADRHAGIPESVAAAGPQYHDQLARTLWKLVQDRNRAMELRAAAAKRLQLVGRDEQVRAEEFLLEATRTRDSDTPSGVDTEEAAVAAAVTAAWQRIHEGLRQYDPATVSAGLPGPATAHEIAVAETALGYRLPPDFAASLAVHRSVELGYLDDLPPTRVHHIDVTEPAGYRDNQRGVACYPQEGPVTAIRWDDPGARAGSR